MEQHEEYWPHARPLLIMCVPISTLASSSHSQKGLNPALPPFLMLFAARMPPKTAVSTVLQAVSPSFWDDDHHNLCLMHCDARSCLSIVR